MTIITDIDSDGDMDTFTETAPGTDNPAVRVLPLDPGATLEVSLTSGCVRIRGTDEARLVIRTRDGRALDGSVVIEAAPSLVRIHDAAGELRLGPIRLTSHRSPDLDMSVPRGTRFAVRTVSGEVDATGVRGASRWTTVSGDLRLVIETGPVAVETMSGDAALTGEGSLAVTARTVSGDLRLAAPLLDGLDLASTSGDVRVEGELRAGGKHVIASVSGDVQLATLSPVRIETQTIAGDVRVAGPHKTEGGRGRRTVILGAGSTPVVIRTTSGDISVEVLSGTAIPMPAPAAPVAAPAAPAVHVTPPAAPAAPTTAPIAPVAPVTPAARVTTPVEPAAPDPTTAPIAPVAPAAVVLSEPAGASLLDSPTEPYTPPVAGPDLGADPATEAREAARLDLLRALERGEIDVETTARGLAALEDAGPLGFRGWS